MSGHLGDRIIIKPVGRPEQHYIFSNLSSRYTDLLQTLKSQFSEDPRIRSNFLGHLLRWLTINTKEV